MSGTVNVRKLAALLCLLLDGGLAQELTGVEAGNLQIFYQDKIQSRPEGEQCPRFSC